MPFLPSKNCTPSPVKTNVTFKTKTANAATKPTGTKKMEKKYSTYFPFVPLPGEAEKYTGYESIPRRPGKSK